MGDSNNLVLIVVFVVLVVGLLWFMQSSPKEVEQQEEQPVENCTSCTEGFAQMEEVPEISIPKKDDSKNKGAEYLSMVADEIFGEDQQLAHQEYAIKRRNAGDHTLQLWGVNDSMRGYSTNFRGPRRPRQTKYDPVSAIQPDTSDYRDFVNPENMRLI